MKTIFKTLSLGMASVMTFFSPMSITHGEGSCCAECVMKREDEVEVVYEEEQNTDGE
jgi:hypothetical protein